MPTPGLECQARSQGAVHRQLLAVRGTQATMALRGRYVAYLWHTDEWRLRRAAIAICASSVIEPKPSQPESTSWSRLCRGSCNAKMP